MKILGNRLLIQPTTPIDKLPSGLYLPQSAVQKPNTGKVVVAGTTASQYWEGKTVLYNKIVAVEIENCHLIHVTDVKFIL